MSIIIPANSAVSGGFNVGNSLRQNRADSSFLSVTFSGDGTHHDKGTISVWVKRSEIGAEAMIYAAGASAREFIRFETNDTLTYRSVGEGYHLNTNAVFRDLSAWYHIVVAFDSSQGTASNRNKIYVNGVQQTSLATATYTPNQNMDHKFLSGELQKLGNDSEQANPFANCYFCEVVGIDGVAHAPTSFGEFDEDTGIWKPISVSGLTFGTNGFHLNFADSSALGTDVSGNGNDFANTNFAATDQSTDTCTNNFATLNPLALRNNPNAYYATFSEGNLKVVGNSSSNNGNAFSTMAFNTGKWYCEVKIIDVQGNIYPTPGVIPEDLVASANSPSNAGQLGYVADDTVAYGSDGKKYIEDVGSSYGDTYTDNDIIGIAIDCDNGAVYFSKNGTFQASGNPTSGASKTNAAMTFTPSKYYFFGVSVYQSTTIVEFNFGSPPYAISSSNADGNGYGNFEYAVPSGYFSLNTKNLAEYG